MQLCSKVFSLGHNYPSLQGVSGGDHYEGYKDLLKCKHCVSSNTGLTTTMTIFWTTFFYLFITFTSVFISIDASPLQRVRAPSKTVLIYFNISGLCSGIKFWSEKQETILQCFYWVWKEKIRSRCGK